jgi:hypothetical protein
MAEIANTVSFSDRLVDAFEIASLAELCKMAEEFFKDIAAGIRIVFTWPAFATAPVAMCSGYAHQRRFQPRDR